MATSALSINTLSAGWEPLSFDLAPDRVAPPTILVVDDEPDHLRFIARSLERLGLPMRIICVREFPGRA
jgi:hypothetical protein